MYKVNRVFSPSCGRALQSHYMLAIENKLLEIFTYENNFYWNVQINTLNSFNIHNS